MACCVVAGSGLPPAPRSWPVTKLKHSSKPEGVLTGPGKEASLAFGICAAATKPATTVAGQSLLVAICRAYLFLPERRPRPYHGSVNPQGADPMTAAARLRQLLRREQMLLAP